jgi:hypothetical protein
LTIKSGRFSSSQYNLLLSRSGTSRQDRPDLGTLLGPEVSVASTDALEMRTGAVGLVAGGPRFRPYVENFTVDASIFVVTTSY